MTSIDILMPRPMLPIVQEQLDAAFTVHRLYEAEDPAKMLAEVGGKIRGIAMAFGPVDADLLAKIPNAEIVSSFGVGSRRRGASTRWVGS